MAKTVYTVEEVELQDGTIVELRPLNIKNLRLFQDKFKEMQSVEGETLSDDDALSKLVDLVAICLKSKLPELVADRDALEEALDIETMYVVIEKCGGIKLNDPNLVAAALAATE